MAGHNVSIEDAINVLLTLPFADFQKIVKQYSDVNHTDFDEDMDRLVTVNLEKRLEKLGINNVCTKCGSKNIMKYGKVRNIQKYKCKDCNTSFTLFSGTILEKTKWHWDVWVKVLEMTLNNISLENMLKTLENDYNCTGINIKTVWLWRMKLIHALSKFPMPKLSGIIQVDETFIRESQKGSRHLESPIKDEKRKPRYGRRPSTLGVMGPEFATVTTAIDNNGYCVCKVSCMGRLTPELFITLFDEYIDNPSFLCSDANNVYETYCKLKNIPHYQKPSNYIKILENNGYITPDYSNPALAAAQTEKNNKILKKLYNNEEIDRITNREYMLFEDFQKLKNANGLSLARVNELHKDLKKYIYEDMTNVSTKYLEEYIGFFTFRRNWRVSHGSYPSSHKDAEEIFIEILRNKDNIKVPDIKQHKLNLPKPNTKYIKKLQEETAIARIATENIYFKFNSEDGVYHFDRRKYLLNQPKTKLYELCKKYNIAHYKQLARYSLVSLLLKQENIELEIYKLLETDRHYKMDDEDWKFINDGKYII